MAQLEPAWTLNAAEVRQKQLFTEDDEFTLTGYDVVVRIWAHITRVTELNAAILDANLGSISWPLGTFLMDCRAGFYSVIYVPIRQSDQAELTWPNRRPDHILIQESPVVSLP